MAALFAVDSNYGRWSEPVEAGENAFRIGERTIHYYDTAQALPD